ncbi:7564_t:CDS:2 [Ambispora leptoticha]|uniref:7564_t:CDS:1 n=1 Tax=Ambispora leptoticha TaxID=144679 RepID=A0A9N8Z6T2_9GLOM|nr:7564_t:CDS:2 [Ambispora leptoticha]
MATPPITGNKETTGRSTFVGPSSSTPLNATTAHHHINSANFAPNAAAYYTTAPNNIPLFTTTSPPTAIVPSISLTHASNSSSVFRCPTLTEFLHQLNLTQYHNRFVEAGVGENDVEQLIGFDEAELKEVLEAILMKPFHSGLFKKGIRELRTNMSINNPRDFKAYNNANNNNCFPPSQYPMTMSPQHPLSPSPSHLTAPMQIHSQTPKITLLTSPISSIHDGNNPISDNINNDILIKMTSSSLTNSVSSSLSASASPSILNISNSEAESPISSILITESSNTNNSNNSNSTTNSLIISSSSNNGIINNSNSENGSISSSHRTFIKNPTVSHEAIVKHATIYGKNSPRQLTQYEQAINRAAIDLALADPTLVTHKGSLFEKAKAKLLLEGYSYKRGASRSKLNPNAPKPGQRASRDVLRAKRNANAVMTSENRNARIADLERKLEAKDNQYELMQETKRTKSEMGDTEGAEKAHHVILGLDKEREEILKELQSLKGKERKHQWYEKRKKERMDSGFEEGLEDMMYSGDDQSVTRLQLGVYANQQPFCLYSFPIPPQEGSLSPIRADSQQTQGFYRLRDLDVLFFESRVGYIYNSGKIPKVYFDTPGYCVQECSGDLYLSARALNSTATRLGNRLLAEFCKLGRQEILAGHAEHLLNSISISRGPFVETEFEFVPMDSRNNIIPSPTLTPRISTQHSPPHSFREYSPLITSSPSSSSTEHHLCAPSSPVNTRKRMSLEEVLDNDESDNRKYTSRIASPVERIVSPNGSDRGNLLIKQESSSPILSGSEHSSNPSSPNHFSKSSPQSPASPNASTTTDLSPLIDDDTRMRKKRKVTISPITSNNIKVTNNPEVMEQVRNTLKLKQQQKAIIEARQQAQKQQILQNQQQNDRRHSAAVSKSSSAAGLEKANNTGTILKRTHNKRNSRNLSVIAPPYNNGQVNNISSSSSARFSPLRGGIPAQQKSPNNYNLSHSNSPIATPITPTMNSRPSSRLSVSGYPLSANSAFRPAQSIKNNNISDSTHSASRSASINGLISPQNVEFPSSSSSSANIISPGVSGNAKQQEEESSSSMAQSHDLVHADRNNKESFINLFDSLYDTVADSRNLKSTLEDQIRKSSTLLQTLQASGSMVESLVRGHFREMQRDIVKDLMTLEKRITKVEKELRQSSIVSMSLSPPLDPDRRFSDISSASYDMGYPHHHHLNHRPSTTTYSGNSSYASRSLYTPPIHVHPAVGGASPPLSATMNGGGSDNFKDYPSMLSALQERLESLERRMSVP